MRGMLIGETALLPMLRSAPLQFSSGIARSQEVLALQRVYVIDAQERFVANKRHRSIPRSFSESPNLLMQRKLTCVNTERCPGRSAVPNLGVTCPPFFRCEAPRSYSSPYSRTSASHRRRTSGACHARRNRLRIDFQSSPWKSKVIPFSRARKLTPITSASSHPVYARK
jgi:hypothetical protein